MITRLCMRAWYNLCVHIAALQYDIVWEDKPANHTMVERMLDDMNLPAETYVVLPEMGDTGFSFNLNAIVDGRTLPWAQSLAKSHRVWMQAGYPVREDAAGAAPPGRNCATIVNPAGEIEGTYQKVHPFSYGKEGEHFTGGDRIILRRVGDAIVCPLICYDLRFPELFRIAAMHGAEVFTIGANWPRERQLHWQTLLRARAIENQAYVVGVNRVGDDPKFSYAGGSMIISPTGQIIAEAGDVETVLTAELDMHALRAWRATFPALKDIHAELLGMIEVDTTGPLLGSSP
jgi:predicted amidohydrolase